MSKNILIKSGILLVVLAVVHSVFWFFKTGQIEKQVNNFISENSSHVSAGEISVSGFPFKQTVTIKDLKFSVPNPAFSKYQISVKNLQATAGIFNSNFTIVLTEQTSIQDNEANISGLVEFSKDPEITATISDGMIAKFSYVDFGHRVLDAEKNVLYASGGANVSFESTSEEGDKIKTKIAANIKDIEGFDIISIYKNAAEKKVIEGIKTGEITIGNSAANPAVLPDSAPVVAVTPTPAVTAAATVAPATTTTTTPAVKSDDMTAAVANNLVKSNFVIDAEYVLTPTQTSADQQTQTDPTQIQETPIQYSKVLKINNLEFSNPLYKITVNGQIDTFQDDSLPSGSVTFKIEKADNLINHIVAGLNQMAENKPAAAPVQSSDLNAANTAATAAAPVPAMPTVATDVNAAPAAPAAPVADDPYQIFLKRFAASLSPIIKEVSAKNQLSKDELSVFDVRREKNLDFLVNEVSTREILGKF